MVFETAFGMEYGVFGACAAYEHRVVRGTAIG